MPKVMPRTGTHVRLYTHRLNRIGRNQVASQYPSIGAWYQDLSAFQLFEVVAIDEQAQTVEIQYLDGSLGEFELEAWNHLHLAPAEAPEDPGPALGLNSEELSPEDDSHLRRKVNPLSTLEPDPFHGYEDYYPWIF